MTTRTCTVAGCSRPHRCKGLCGLHYGRSLAGRPLGGPDPLHKPARALLNNIDRSAGEDACWPWLGNITSWGYGRIRVDGRDRGAHRVVYEHFHGPVPDDLDLDHTCHNADDTCPGGTTCLHRRCVNPAHLVPATRRDNVLRGNTLTSSNATKTHCNHGHEFTPDNTYVNPLGYRGCRACGRARAAAKRAARKAAV